MGHRSQADTAEAELAVDGLGPTALLAAGVRPYLKLRLAGLLDLDSCGCHTLPLLLPDGALALLLLRRCLVRLGDLHCLEWEPEVGEQGTPFGVCWG